MAPATTTIAISAGTIVMAHRNEMRNGKPTGRIFDALVTLGSDVIIDNATRLDDGRWGFSIGRYVYSCAGGLAQPLHR